MGDAYGNDLNNQQLTTITPLLQTASLKQIGSRKRARLTKVALRPDFC